MKHAIRITTIAAAATYAACFGAGPEPTPPAKATIVYGVAPKDPNACAWTYLGDVAFSTDLGFALEIPYGPSECGGQTPSAPINVVQFAKSGGAAMRIGSAGMTNTMMIGGEPRLVVVDGQNAGVEWAFADSGGSDTHLTFQTPTNGSAGLIGPSDAAVSMLGIGSDIYVVTAPGGGSQPDDVYFPGRGDAQMTSASVRRLHGTSGTPGSVPAECGYANHCLAANSSSVFYFDNLTMSGNSQYAIRSFALGGDPSAGSNVATTVTNAPRPVGLVTVGETALVYASTADNDSMISGNPTQGCVIQYQDLTSNQTRQLLETPNFSCMDLAFDGTYVYFAIVMVLPQDPGNDNTGTNNNNTLHGLGIGRVDIQNGDFRSIAVGIQGVTSGPRRVYVDATSIYAVDPHVIGKIDKSLLDNANDISK